MNPAVIRTPEAIRDLLELADYIARDNFDAALRFLDAADSTFQFLAESPDIGNRCSFASPQAAGLLRWRIKGFERYLIFYRRANQRVEIVRILHSARDLEAIFEDE